MLLPDLIFSENDLDFVKTQNSRPNFITTKKLTAPVATLENLSRADLLQNCIVVIENADPGYDWIFGHSIAGLITKYGGANSHMAIRCAEFGIPAAIGCGASLFESIRFAKHLILDCEEKIIRRIN